MGANAGTKILASQYNGWWTTLNQIRTSWNQVGSSVTPITVSAGTSATASNMNSLINQVNALKSYYSGADWANFTEATKSVGQKIEYPSKMEWMLNYLKGVCAHNSTNSTFGDFGNFGTNPNFGDNPTFGNNSVQSNNSVCSTFNTCSTQSNFSNFSTEGGGYSLTWFSGNTYCDNNGTRST